MLDAPISRKRKGSWPLSRKQDFLASVLILTTVIFLLVYFFSGKKVGEQPVTPSEGADIGYYRSATQTDGRFIFTLPEECLEERDESRIHFDYKVIITCKLGNFELIIQPQVVDRDAPVDTVYVAQGRYNTPDKNMGWEYSVNSLPSGDLYGNNAGGAVYSTTLNGELYRVSVIFKPYSNESRTYFESILSTFKLLE